MNNPKLLPLAWVGHTALEQLGDQVAPVRVPLERVPLGMPLDDLLVAGAAVPAGALALSSGLLEQPSEQHDDDDDSFERKSEAEVQEEEEKRKKDQQEKEVSRLLKDTGFLG